MEDSHRTRHRSFCRLCIANCAIEVEVEHTADGARAIAVRGDASHPVSAGYTCSKGRALPDLHSGADRLDSPLVRRDGELAPTGWAEVLADLDARLGEIVREHGTDSIGFFTGGGAYLDAAAYWAAKRVQRRLGTRHAYSTMSIDSSAKYRVAEMVAGTTALALHVDPEARLVLMFGTNPVVSHGQTPMFENPVERMRFTTRRSDVWVVDPRTTETARLADHHLAIRPGADHALLAYLVRGVLEGVDRAALHERAEHVDELIEAVDPFTLEHAQVLTDLPRDQLVGLLDAVRHARRLAVLSGTGVTMSPGGNLVEWLIWALLITTDSVDRPGGMWCNPGYLAGLDRRPSLPALAPAEPGPATRPDVARLLGEWPSAAIPSEIEAGNLRALVVFGGNLVTCLPDTQRVLDALRRLDLLVVLEVARTPTAELTTHVLPMHAQLERADVALLGDLFSSAVTTQYTEPVLPGHPGRRAQWWTIARLGRSLGVDILPAELDLDSASDDDVLGHLIGGDLLALLRDGELPWAVRSRPEHGWVEPRLPTGRWDLAPAPLREQLHDIAEPAPLVLIPRRQPKRVNGTTMRDGDRADLLLNPVDAAELGVADGDLVDVTSSSGSLRLTVAVTDAIRHGATSLAHGWSDVNVNTLIDSDWLDPLTGMPRMSGTPVSVVPVAVGATTSS
jgi:anaerobic selenocysteine-containing dehydrogenase